MAGEHNVIILGAGHNGLATAFYLAKGGLKPLVLERRDTVGGAAVTEEIHPGFRCSTLAHFAGPLRPEIASDMQLERRGAVALRPDPRVFAPLPDGRALWLFSDAKRSAAEVAAFSQRDAQKYPEFQSVLERIGGVLRGVLEAPPDISHPGAGDLMGLLKTGRGFRGLGRKDMFRLLRWGPMAAADLAAEFFETELLRAVVAARGVFGCALGPWSAGSSMVLLLRLASDAHPAGGAVAMRGGLGGLTQAMADAAREAGAEIRTRAEVEQILVKDGRVAGVALRGGEEIPAKAIVSNADPKRTLLNLVDPVHLTPGFVVKLRNFRANGVLAKVNLALDGLPHFTAVKDSNGANGIPNAAALSGRIHIAPEIDYIERAFDASKYGRFSEQPYIEAYLPSLGDPTLAPPGKHVMSIYAQFAPYHLREGEWTTHRTELGDTVIRTLAQYAPDLPEKILARQILTPQDMELNFGLTGGHPYHGDLALDQIFTMRPLLDWARYRTPIEGLYLCGAGTHPGLGITGDSGRNAARELLKDWRK